MGWPIPAIISLMKVIKIEPHSYCEGVTRAFLIAKKAKERFPDAPIYLLGSLVHNEKAVESLLHDGFRIIDERNGDLKDELKDLPDASIVIFSAHGHPEEYDEIAKEKKIVAIDASCPKVLENLKRIKSYLSLGREIVYLGEKGHLEAKAALSFGPKVHFLDAKNLDSFAFESLSDPAPILLTQTTLSDEEVNKGSAFLLSKKPASFIIDTRCDSTKKRQFAILSAPFEADLFVILGSLSSNNTMELVHLARQSHPEARIIRALDINELKKFDLKRNHICALASGASTSPSAYDECLKYLESL